MADKPARKTRVTAAQKLERAEIGKKEERTREWIVSQAKRANTLRNKDKEFHGLEREFLYLQEKMLADYQVSKDIKHIRDKGNAREVLLREFFLSNKLLPSRYNISNVSMRAVSTTGHLSKELDILFHDVTDGFSLMQRQNVIEVIPIEYCYGAIQVKSKLTKKELENGFENIASFKRLQKLKDDGVHILKSSHKAQRQGFGIIFAYESDMDWADIVAEIKTNAEKHPRHLIPNAVFILSKGSVVFGDKNFGSVYNTDISSFENLIIYGTPDRDGLCLYRLYEIVFSLLRNTLLGEAVPHNYFRLPLTAGEYSYEFQFGHFREMGRCEEHGDFARLFSAEKLETLINWCKTAESINWIKATDIAYGKPGDDYERYDKQPHDVRIYNPEALPLSEILTHEAEFYINGESVAGHSLAFDSIQSCGLTIWIPYYYQVKCGMINGCPKCEKKASSKPNQKA